MKRLLTSGCVSAILLSGFMASAQDQGADVQLDTEIDKVSYSIGVQMARQFQSADVELNPDAFAEGLRDVFAGEGLALEDQTMQTTLQEFQQKVRQQQQEAQAEMQREMQRQAEAGAKEAEEFLAENAEKEGVEQTESGLQYQVMSEGSGASPDANDVVQVHYEGKLLDGSVFDTSEGGDPVSFPVNRVIDGWQEALQLMEKGAEYRLFIPPDLAYGPQGSPPDIPPNSALIFDVELLDVEKVEGTEPQQPQGMQMQGGQQQMSEEMRRKIQQQLQQQMQQQGQQQ